MSTPSQTGFFAWFGRAIAHPRLGLYLALVAMAFASPSLFIGFHLDDFVGRYAYSDLPDADRLFKIMSGGFGITNGNPDDIHWLIEQGYAPWWTYPKLLLGLFRPVSILIHYADFAYFPDAAVLMHAENLLWFGAFVLLGTRFFRGILGPTVGGLAAFLYAFDHTHGFAVGFIANRNALVTVALGFLALQLHHAARQSDRFPGILAASAAYALALLAGEMSLAAMGYFVAYALFVDRGSMLKRALGVAPYLLVSVVWRGAYNALGYGAKYCGLYVDPGREPAHFVRVLFERGPILLLGEFLAPPADAASLSPALASVILAMAVGFVILLALTLWPLWKRSPTSRFWTLGMVLSLVPAATSHPSNRLLFYVGIGAMGLVAELWDLYAVRLVDHALGALEKLSRAFGGLLVLAHLVVSPLALPFTSVSVALTAPIRTAFEDVHDDVGGRDAVFMNPPDYYSVRLLAMERRVRREPLPRRWRVISYGPTALRVRRTDETTVVVDYEGGILATPMMELFRDRRLRMSPGETVELDGLVIKVLAVTDDGRARSAEFAFDAPLRTETFRFYAWENNHFVPFEMPAVGTERTLPAPMIRLGFE